MYCYTPTLNANVHHQWGQIFCSLSEAVSASLDCVSEQWRLWRACIFKEYDLYSGQLDLKKNHETKESFLLDKRHQRGKGTFKPDARSSPAGTRDPFKLNPMLGLHFKVYQAAIKSWILLQSGGLLELYVVGSRFDSSVGTKVINMYPPLWHFVA